MPREWDYGEARHKRHAEDRRDPPRPSPDELRHEEELRRELWELRDGCRNDRRSPPRRDNRGRSRSPWLAVSGDWRPWHRSPSPAPRRGRSPSPSRSKRLPSPRSQAQPAAPASRKYVPPHAAAPSAPASAATPGGGSSRGRQGPAKKKKRRGQGRGKQASLPRRSRVPPLPRAPSPTSLAPALTAGWRVTHKSTASTPSVATSARILAIPPSCVRIDR
nr:serine/arginine repetitive matrix protein 1-like [Aegilops tauschii subsp. strangulata]